MSATNGTHVPELISRAELARRRGCTRAAVTQVCRERLAVAVQGKKVDAAHPETRLWLAGTDRGPTAPSARTPRKPAKAAKVTRAAGRAAAKERRDRSELFAIAMRKKRAEVAAIEIKVAERRGELISRELVERHLFGALRTLSARMLRDIPKNLALKLATLSPEQRREEIYKTNSEALRWAKQAMLRALREGRDDPDPAG
jgi:hypothetical protein